MQFYGFIGYVYLILLNFAIIGIAAAMLKRH